MVKVILHQFDVSKKKKKKDKPDSDAPDFPMGDIDEELEEESKMTDDQVEEMVRVLDKEEKEMDEAPEEGDEEENENLVRDIKKIEEVMEEEVFVRGHHSPPPITPASSDSPRYIPPHKRPNHRQLLETRP